LKLSKKHLNTKVTNEAIQFRKVMQLNSIIRWS